MSGFSGFEYKLFSGLSYVRLVLKRVVLVLWMLASLVSMLAAMIVTLWWPGTGVVVGGSGTAPDGLERGHVLFGGVFQVACLLPWSGCHRGGKVLSGGVPLVFLKNSYLVGFTNLSFGAFHIRGWVTGGPGGGAERGRKVGSYGSVFA